MILNTMLWWALIIIFDVGWFWYQDACQKDKSGDGSFTDYLAKQNEDAGRYGLGDKVKVSTKGIPKDRRKALRIKARIESAKPGDIIKIGIGLCSCPGLFPIKVPAGVTLKGR